MARGREEYVTAVRSRTTVFWAAGFVLLAAMLSSFHAVHGEPIFAYGSVLLFIAGTSLSIPNLVEAFASGLDKWLEQWFGVELRCARSAARWEELRFSLQLLRLRWP